MEYGIKQPLRCYENETDRNKHLPGGNNEAFFLLCPLNMLLPFQIKRETGFFPLTSILLKNESTGAEMELLTYLDSSEIEIFSFTGFDYIIHYGILPHLAAIDPGKYYLIITDTVKTWYTETIKFADFDDATLAHCVPTKVTYFDTCDVGDIFYRTSQFGAKEYKNLFYLDIDIGKPEYPTTVEASEDAFGIETADFARWEKTYLLQGVFPQFFLDAITLLPLHLVSEAGRVQVRTNRGYQSDVVAINIDSKWQDAEGAIALTDISFVTDRVIKTKCCDNLESPVITCLRNSVDAVAFIEEGTANYINFEYTNGDLEQIPLEDDDKVLIKYLSGSVQYRRYKESSGTYILTGVFANGAGVRDVNTETYYYFHTATNRFYSIPVISEIETPVIISPVGWKTIKGRAWKYAAIEIWETISGTAELIAVGTGEQFISDGITYPHNAAATTTYVKVKGLNCVLGQSASYLWSTPLGIGVMAVGSTNIVGEDPPPVEETE
jgi:hypothetical protein